MHADRLAGVTCCCQAKFFALARLLLSCARKLMVSSENFSRKRSLCPKGAHVCSQQPCPLSVVGLATHTEHTLISQKPHVRARRRRAGERVREARPTGGVHCCARSWGRRGAAVFSARATTLTTSTLASATVAAAVTAAAVAAASLSTST
eukprot:3609380-Prymnesium_polylepis.1